MNIQFLNVTLGNVTWHTFQMVFLCLYLKKSLGICDMSDPSISRFEREPHEEKVTNESIGPEKSTKPSWLCELSKVWNGLQSQEFQLQVLIQKVGTFIYIATSNLVSLWFSSASFRTECNTFLQLLTKLLNDYTAHDRPYRSTIKKITHFIEEIRKCLLTLHSKLSESETTKTETARAQKSRDGSSRINLNPHPKHLFFGGGVFKVFTFLGALQQLSDIVHEHNSDSWSKFLLNLQSASGASAGCFIALFVSLKMDVKAAISLFYSMSFDVLADQKEAVKKFISFNSNPRDNIQPSSKRAIDTSPKKYPVHLSDRKHAKVSLWKYVSSSLIDEGGEELEEDSDKICNESCGESKSKETATKHDVDEGECKSDSDNGYGVFSRKGIEKTVCTLLRHAKFPEATTLKEHYKKTGVKLRLYTSDANTGELFIIDCDSAPDMKVCTAIGISCSIPYVFKSGAMNVGTWERQRTTQLVDGVLKQHISLFESSPLDSYYFFVTEAEKNTINGSLSFLKALFNMSTNSAKDIVSRLPPYQHCTFFIPTNSEWGIEALLYSSLPITEKQKIVHAGITAIKNIVK